MENIEYQGTSDKYTHTHTYKSYTINMYIVCIYIHMHIVSKMYLDLYTRRLFENSYKTTIISFPFVLS